MIFNVDLDIPEDAVVVHGVHMFNYLDEDGKTRYVFSLQGDAPIISVIGLIAVVHHHLLRYYGVGE